MSTLIHQRVDDCRAGRYPKAICRLSSGWVVLGDVQFVRGYSLLLPDPVVTDLNKLRGAARVAFLSDMAAVGDALLSVTNAVRINYEILGNVDPALHAHVFPRYSNEPEDLKVRPVWFYDWTKAPPFDPKRDEPLMSAIRARLEHGAVPP
jgi:diadenosine tetraphosphate (Ap4A) HIT family hydrolase